MTKKNRIPQFAESCRSLWITVTYLGTTAYNTRPRQNNCVPQAESAELNNSNFIDFPEVIESLGQLFLSVRPVVDQMARSGSRHPIRFGGATAACAAYLPDPRS